MIRKIMNWIRRKLESPHTREVLTRVDRTLTQAPIQVEYYRRQIEVLTGKPVVLPDGERKKLLGEK